MSRGYNKVILGGNLTRDPELRYTTSKMAVVTMILATNRAVKQKDGTWKNEADFHRVKVWGKQAEACKRYLSKGAPVFVEGRLSTSSYEDKSGQKRWATEVVANEVIFSPMNKKNDNTSSDLGPLSDVELAIDDIDEDEGNVDIPF